MTNALRMIPVSIVAQLAFVLVPSLVLSDALTQITWGEVLGTTPTEPAAAKQVKNQIFSPLRESVGAPGDSSEAQVGQVDWTAQVADFWSSPAAAGQSPWRLVGGEYFSNSGELESIVADELIPSASDAVSAQGELSYSFSEPLSMTPFSISDQGTAAIPKTVEAVEERQSELDKRPVIIFQPAVPAESRDGGVTLRPRVRVLDESKESELSPSLSVSRLPTELSQ